MKRNWLDKKIVILGLSKSGVSAAKYLTSRGADCSISESRELKTDDEGLINELQSIGIQVEMGGHTDTFINDAYLAITSPGIPPRADIFNKLKEQNISVISEIELSYLEALAPFIAVTGTNGKTTTTEFISHVLSTEYKAPTCGNIGIPPSGLLDKKNDYFVCEVSSYQLQFSPTFTPQIGLWLNFTPDHVDWHEGLENYFQAKAKLFEPHKMPAFAIFNATDENVFEFSKNYNGEKYYFGKELTGNCCYIKENAIYFKKEGVSEKIIELDEISLVGEHNYQNIEAGVIVAKLVGIAPEHIQQAIKTFKAPEHRCEFVKTINGINFYNDSKATNPEASIFAIKSFANKSVTLIAGGRDKNTSLAEFCKVVNDYVKDVILIGEASERFKTELQSSGFNNIHFEQTMENAIDKARILNNKIVLLSPACASFDMYANFEQRGESFKNYVLSKL